MSPRFVCIKQTKGQMRDRK